MATLYFDPRAEHAVAILDDENGYPFPKGSSSHLAIRYVLDGEKVVDRYKGLSDEEAMAKFEADRAAKLAAEIAADEAALAAKNAVVTRLNYLRRFTQAERIALREIDNPVVKDFLMMVELAEEINLLDADTVGGTNYLEAEGFIGQGRAAEILAI